MFRDRNKKDDEPNAVSITTGFILNLGIATVAVGITLFLITGTYSDIRTSSAESELKVVGEKISAEIEKVHRMSNLQQNSNPSVELNMPDIDRDYTVNITSDTVQVYSGQAEVTLNHGADMDSQFDDGVVITPEITPVIRTNSNGELEVVW